MSDIYISKKSNLRNISEITSNFIQKYFRIKYTTISIKEIIT